MKPVWRFIKGGHRAKEMRWHLLALTGGFWGLVLLARLGYPPENNYSITTRMLSDLGSFDSRSNPRWFWLFSLAMVYCGIMMTPVMFYMHRHLKRISWPGATAGLVFFLTGCLSILLTGLFPYSRTPFLGELQWAEVHDVTALSIGICFSLGALWIGLLLLRERLFHRRLQVHPRWGYSIFFFPFLIVLVIFVLLGVRMHWGLFFSSLPALFVSGAQAAHDAFMKSTYAIRSDALVEHIAIWGLTLFIVSFAALLPEQHEDIKSPPQLKDAEEGG